MPNLQPPPLGRDDLAQRDADTESIRAFNAKLHKDKRVSLSLLPIGDGLTLARKRR